MLQGAWFATPDNRGFNAFAARYRGRFNADPIRLATLSYDAVTLAAALTRVQGSQRFSDEVLTNPAASRAPTAFSASNPTAPTSGRCPSRKSGREPPPQSARAALVERNVNGAVSFGTACC